LVVEREMRKLDEKENCESPETEMSESDPLSSYPHLAVSRIVGRTWAELQQGL
jgi:hypothetical protein